MFILALISVWSNLACIIANIQPITHCAALFFIRSPLLELQCLPQQQAFTQLPATIAGLCTVACHTRLFSLQSSVFSLQSSMPRYVPPLHYAPLSIAFAERASILRASIARAASMPLRKGLSYAPCAPLLQPPPRLIFLGDTSAQEGDSRSTFFIHYRFLAWVRTILCYHVSDSVTEVFRMYSGIDVCVLHLVTNDK